MKSSKLLSTTINDFQRISSELKADDPGVIVEIEDFNHLHACLGLQHSPVPQGANVVDSYNSFRAWLRACAIKVPGITVANCKGFAAFDHLSEEQAHDLLSSWQVTNWALEVRNQNWNPPAIIYCLPALEKERPTFSVHLCIYLIN